jgi:hypothetical protein
MPLNKAQLESDLLSRVFVDSGQTKEQVCARLAQAIDDYVRQALVTVTVTVDPGTHAGGGEGSLS